MTRTVTSLDDRRIGLLCLLMTAVGWGIAWPVMKVLLRELPPLSARGLAGVTAAVGLAGAAIYRGERLGIPRHAAGRLLLAAGTNVTAWMGLGTLCMLWLNVAEGALLVYTMPIWTTLFAWLLLGERPTVRGLAALALGFAGVVVLLAGLRGGMTGGLGKLPGVAFALGAAVLFASGAVMSRGRPLPLSPLASAAWQVGLGCFPLIALGLLTERPDLGALTVTGWMALAYMTAVPMGACYLTWFTALRRLPPTTASMATLLTPLVGVAAAAPVLGETLGLREGLALCLTLGGVALALGRTA